MIIMIIIVILRLYLLQQIFLCTLLGFHPTANSWTLDTVGKLQHHVIKQGAQKKRYYTLSLSLNSIQSDCRINVLLNMTCGSDISLCSSPV